MKLEAVKLRAKHGLVNKYPQKKEAAKPAKSLLLFAPAVGIEPTSNWLKVNYSTAELRRSFITNATRKTSTVGGSLGNVQMLAGHSSFSATQQYIEDDSEERKKIVDLI